MNPDGTGDERQTAMSDAQDSTDEDRPLGRDDEMLSHERRLMASALIMMVDDEPLNTEVLKIHLESEGYDRFVSVSDSRRALSTLRAERPDVLLLDLVMPDVSGFDILEEMRRDESLRQTPVIVLTSSNDAETKLLALRAGATDFLAKPVDASELALRMRNTLASRAWQKRVSLIDVLTGLPNRLFFMRVLECRLDPPDEAGPGGTAALIVVNINRFKSINDSLGPDQGDAVLRAFRDRLVSGLGSRPSLDEASLFDSRQLGDPTFCCVARLGGDRFGIVLPIDSLVPDADALASHLQRFAAAMETPFVVADQTIYLSASIGVSMIERGAGSLEGLINDAETAMRHAQRRDGTAFAFYSEHMDARARELLSLENGLRTAIDDGEIFVLYQPKVDVASGALSGAEALVRWMNPEFGLISPDDFIPLAEDTGTIVSIGAWVMQESCRQMRLWHDRGAAHLCMAVNVSIRQLHEPGFIAMVREALRESGLAPEALVIELTENMLMENAGGNMLKLCELKELGVRLSIDDFGTGYSSLAYLQRFPLDQLKIDRSFISGITAADSPAPIVKAVISLAHDLGLSVVAEGIETEAQLLRVRDWGCEEFQGFYYSRPVPADEYEAMVAEEARRRA